MRDEVILRRIFIYASEWKIIILTESQNKKKTPKNCKNTLKIESTKINYNNNKAFMIRKERSVKSGKCTSGYYKCCKVAEYLWLNRNNTGLK